MSECGAYRFLNPSVKIRSASGCGASSGDAFK